MFFLVLFVSQMSSSIYLESFFFNKQVCLMVVLREFGRVDCKTVAVFSISSVVFMVGLAEIVL